LSGLHLPRPGQQQRRRFRIFQPGHRRACYRVKALNVCVASLPTSVLSATTLPPPSNPPSGLSATAASAKLVNLAWSDNSANETGFKVERSTDGVTFTLLATLGANVVAYTNANLAASTKYHYRVVGFRAPACSAYPSVVNATTKVPPPAPPTRPTAMVGASGSKTNNLAWANNANNEAAYYVKRSMSGASSRSARPPGSKVM
jgi:hypothetical protein